MSRRPRAAVPAVAWWGLLVLVALASVLRGGNRGVALIGLEWLALGVLLLLTARGIGSGRGLSLEASGWRRLAIWVLASAPVVGALVQMGLSSTPVATAFAYLAGLPVLACFLAALLSSKAQARSLARLWLIVAVVQAAIGLLQLGTGDWLRFDAQSGEPAIGTFASKNTYANLLVMAVPLAMAFLLGQGKNESARTRGSRWAWGLALFVLVVTVLATTSRTGIATGLLVLLLSTVLLPAFDSEGGRKTRRWMLAGALGLIALGLLAGGVDWATRFDGDTLAGDNAFRAEMRAATAQAALAQLPLGSGLGSFPWVSSEFQPAVAGRFWFDLVHSDYLQLMSDTGLLGLVWILAALALYIYRGWGLVAQAGQQGDALPLACGLGLLAFGLHAWVDYPFHIPANAMMAATLFGLMLRERSDIGSGSYKK